MAAANLEERVDALEREVRILKSAVKKRGKNQSPWWEKMAGMFKDDHLFDEIVASGKRYRRSLSSRKR